MPSDLVDVKFKVVSDALSWELFINGKPLSASGGINPRKKKLPPGTHRYQLTIHGDVGKSATLTISERGYNDLTDKVEIAEDSGGSGEVIDGPFRVKKS